MGRIFVLTLEGKIYSCKHCGTHLAVSEDVVSKGLGDHGILRDCESLKSVNAYGFYRTNMLNFLAKFEHDQELAENYFLKSLSQEKESFHCRHGKAYLFNKVTNITAGMKEERMMMTGLHTVADIYCVGCGSNVGWKYETAHEKNQKYKEGKSVLERFKISGPDGNNYMAPHETYVGGSDDADDV